MGSGPQVTFLVLFWTGVEVVGCVGVVVVCWVCVVPVGRMGPLRVGRECSASVGVGVL